MNESASKEKDENNKQNNGISELDLNIDNLNEEQLLELAIKRSLEQENLEIERDKEAQLIQYAIYNENKRRKNRRRKIRRKFRNLSNKIRIYETPSINPKW